MGSTVERIAAATTGRDRVMDAAKTFALVMVVVGHSLAWHVTPDGRTVNVLEVEGRVVPLTWLFQVLPLFFAVGALSNMRSMQRHGARDFLAGRARGLLTPVVVYAGWWTIVLLPLSVLGGTVVDIGRFLAQLLWFAGVYLLVVTAAPLTSRWAARPMLTLVVWLAAVLAVEAARLAGAPDSVGWLNLLLVWGWLHQLGYSLPRLRAGRGAAAAAGAAALLAAAVALAALGPYSSSLVSYAGDPELSNLAPPSTVLLLYGAAQILALAAAWPWLDRLLSRDRLWAGVALVGSRAMGIYLWHIPLVGLIAGAASLLRVSGEPLSPAWWALHVSTVVVVLPAAWLLAGVAAAGERRIGVLPRWFGAPPAAVGVLGGLVVLNISVTGFATLSGAGALGLASSAVANLLVLLIAWQAAGRPQGDRVRNGSVPA